MTAGVLRLVRIFIVVGACALFLPALALAHSGPSYSSAPLSVVPNLDDGAIAPGEWTDAAHYTLVYGGVAGDLYLKNTATDLYVGFQIADPNTNVERFAVQFDSNHNGTLDAGDDQWQQGYGATFDSFWDGSSWLNDVTDGGGYYEVSGRGYWNPTTHIFTAEWKHSLCGPDATRVNPIDVCLNLNGPHAYGIEFKYETNGFIGGAPAVLNDVNQWSDVQMADNIPPDVSWSTPTSGSTISGVTSLSATATDNVFVNKIEFYVQDAGAGTFSLVGTAVAGLSQIDWDTHNRPNGVYSMKARAYDSASNWHETTVSNVTINNALPPDTTPPTVSVTAPSAGSMLNGVVTVSATATDSQSAIDHVDFKYFDGTFHFIASDSTAPYSAQFDTRTVRNVGALAGTVYAFAYDTPGNSAGFGNGVGIANPERIDVDQSNSNTSVGVADGYFGQSFTTGIDGYLTQIAVSMFCSGGGAATLKIYPGNLHYTGPALPAPIATQSVTLSTPGCGSFTATNQYFRLDTPIRTTPGSQYTFIISGAGSIGAPMHSSDPYPSGQFYGGSPASDLVFATYVDALAPAGPPPVITASISGNYVNLNNFAPNTDVTVAITVPFVTNTITRRTDASGNLMLSPSDVELDLLSGSEITATQGPVAKSLTLEPVTFGQLTPAGIASGTATAGRTVNIYVDSPSLHLEATAVTDEAGNWSYDFAGPIPAGAHGAADVIDSDGDHSRADIQTANPTVTASVTYGWFQLNDWMSLHEIRVVFSFDGGAELAQYYTVDAGGFLFVPQSTHDVAIGPGLVITATDMVTGVTKTLNVTGLTINLNAATNVASGTGPAGSTVDVNINTGDGPRQQVTIPAGGSWSVDFSPFDVTLGMGASVSLLDADFDRSQADVFLPVPTISASVNKNWIQLNGWPANDAVDITFSDDSASLAVTTNASGQLFVGPQQVNRDLVPGVVITASDGPSTKELTLRNVTITSVNAAGSTIEGFAPAFSTVNVNVNNGPSFGSSLTTTANADGHWLAETAITGSWNVNASVADPDGDQSSASMFLPLVNASISSDIVSGSEWPANDDVTITVASADVSRPVTTDADGTFYLDSATLGVNLVAGTVVEASDGTYDKVLTLANLTFDSLDAATKIASGYAPAGVVLVCLNSGESFLGCRTTTSNGGSPWSLDFTSFIDVQPGTNGNAQVKDADGDGTSVEFGTVPDTTIENVPGDGTSDGGTFNFSSPTPGAQFECAVDSNNFQPCASPKTVYVTAGTHLFKVRAVQSGRPDPTPATATWVQTLPAASETTARVDLVGGLDTLDTSRAYTSTSWQILYATCAKLVNYPDEPVPDALELTPEVATELPTPTNGGRDYTFTIRSGFAFANGEAVTAQSFKDALLRVLSPTNDIVGAAIFQDIAGAAAYHAGAAEGVSGLSVNSDNTLTISLLQPKPDILQRLATPFACPVPTETPMSDRGSISGSGPYTVASMTNDLIVLERNAHYGGTRPSPFATERVFVGVDQLQAQERALAGATDYVMNNTAPDQTDYLKTHYPSQFFVNSTLATWYLGMNASRPPFDNPNLRRAISFVLDRNALAAATPGGSFTPTDQIVSPGLPGFNDWLLYPYGGDLTQALSLAETAGVSPTHRITAELYTCNSAQCAGTSNVIRANLAQIGIDVNIHAFPKFQQIAKEMTPGEPFDLNWEGWAADYPDASNYFDSLFKTGVTFNFDHYSSEATDARIAEADQAPFDTRYALWANLDRDLMSGDAPVAPALNGTSRDLFSSRIGCQVFNPIFGMDLARLCISGPVAVSDFSLVANAPSAPAGAGVVDPLDIPVGALPLQTLAQAAAPLRDVGVQGSPLRDVPLRDVGLGAGGGALSSLLLSQVPLIGRSWEQLLSGTTLANVPVQNITFAQAQTVASAAIGAITLSQIDLSQSPLRDVGLAALALGATPLRDIPIPGASGDPLVNWCTALAGPPISCIVSTSLTGETVMSSALKGAPLRDIPLRDVPLRDVNLSASPLRDIPLRDVNVQSSPLRDVPLRDIVLNAAPLRDIPLRDIPLRDIPLRDIPLRDIASVVTKINCAAVDCVNGTLDDAAAANAIPPGTTLGDIVANLDGYTLGDLGAFFGATTVGDILAGLPPDFTIGDLLLALIDPRTFAWEKLPFDQMQVQSFTTGGGVLGYTATFKLTGGNVVATADLSATIPAGALYLKMSSKLQATGGKNVAAPDPTVSPSGTGLRWNLKNVVVGREYKLRFNVGTSLKLGPSQANAAVAAIGDPASVPSPTPAAADITETLETGDDVASATTLQPNKVYFAYVNRSTDSDFYTFNAPPAGTRVTVRLGNLANDDDLVMYSPAGAPQLRASGIPGVPLQSPPVADEGLSASNVASVQQPSTLQDVHLRSASIAGISANRGTTAESVQSTSTGTGTYTIQVSGYNGQTSDLPYTIRIEEDPPVPPPACSPRVFDHAGQGTAGTIPAAYNPNLNTIFIVDAKRIGDTYGAGEETNVLNALNTLAGRNDLGISGAVVSVEDNPSVQNAYNTWDTNPCDPTLANGVVTAIGSVIDTIRAARPSLKYVVMVGADDIVPMARVPDNTQIANEKGYSSTFAAGSNNEYYGSLYARNLLSDQPYADIDPIAILDRQIYVPDLSLGRLVETPGQIVSALTQYQTFGGVLNPTTSLTTGYDFLTDGSQAVAASLAAKVGNANAQTMINETWTAGDLIAKLFPLNAPSPGIVSLNAHFDHQNALPAFGNSTNNQSELFAVGQVPAGKLAGRIWFSMGCHAGLNVSDVIVGSSNAIAPDWAQTLASQGAVFGANTGYGLGDDAAVAYSERLMALFASHLDGSMRVGEAWKQAQQDYWSTLGLVSVYDEKVMEEATFYGLPMYGVGAAPGLVPLAVGTHASTQAAPVVSPIAPDPITGTDAANFTVSPSFTKVDSTNARGSYYKGDDGVVAVNYRPLIPVTNIPLAAPGKTLHGIVITAPGLQSTDELNFDVVFERPTVDLSVHEPEPVFGDASFPSTIATVRSFGSPSARQQRGILATGQFFTDDTPDAKGVGIMRRWTQIAGKALYDDSSDFLSPTILASDAITFGTSVGFTVHTVDDTAGDSVKFVYVVFRDGTGTWKGTYLAHGAGDSWSGGSAASGSNIEYFVQVGDTHGNVAVSSNKAHYFAALPPPPPPPPPSGDRGRIDISVSGTPAAGGWYAGAVQVTLQSTNDSKLTYAVDSGPSTSYSGAFTVSGNGFHTVDAQGSDGSSASTVALIDGAAPTIVVTSPAKNGIYLIGASVKADYACVDAGSGATQCHGTVANGQPVATGTVGANTFQVDAADAAGHTTALDQPYQVIWPFSGFFSPIANLPIVNQANSGQAIPTKFSLGGNRGLAIFAAGYPKSEQINCNSNAPLGALVSTTTAGASSLSYDAGSNQYNYVWKTDKAWANTCRNLVLRLADGTEHVTSFKLK